MLLGAPLKTVSGAEAVVQLAAKNLFFVWVEELFLCVVLLLPLLLLAHAVLLLP